MADIHDGAREQRELLRELLLEKYEPIAVIGVGLRLPGGNRTVEGLAEFLRDGRSGTGPVPAGRWDVEKYHSTGAAVKGRISAAGGGFVEDVDMFDARFFNISPKEAQYIDPQHRLAMETTWEALEHANVDPFRLGGNGGVYFGISCFDYTLEIGALADDELDAYVGTGTAHSAVPGRISYLLGWRGPSIAIDTACSSSLAALDLAVAGLRRRDCDVAVSGGVNAIHHPLNHIVFSQAGMLSPDGRCKTFDDSADGYGRSEGCGVVVLKRLSDARRDGDRVLALIRGSAVRQDGESGGLTVPNGSAQEAVMRAAIDNAAMTPADIQYVEAHGTGTPLGNPIEMGSINAVFAGSHSRAAPIVVGSLKTNLGHMEAAAGIGGVLKTVLQLYHGEMYAHINVTTPSTRIPWDRYAVTVPHERRPWEAPVRRALVNSFGFAGTIASIVLEQPPAAPAPASAAPDGPVVVTVSAKTDKALDGQLQRLRAYVETSPDVPVRDLAYTSNVGRAHFGTRFAAAVSSREELLAALAKGPREAGDTSGAVAFLFTGQGSQHVGMGRVLYERQPAFRRHVDECDRLFAAYLGRSIVGLMFGDEGDARELSQTRYSQPALFTLEYAAARLWIGWGVRPSVLIGHSIGEVVAATVAEVLPLAAAVRLVAARARLMQAVTAPGGMVSVQAPAAAVAPLIAGFADVSFAAFNAPEQCVVSGGSSSLAIVEEHLTERGMRHQRLVVSHAFHSPLMRTVCEEFRAAIAGIPFGEPTIAVVSNVTGTVATATQLGDPDYWVRHIVEPVDFLAGMRAVAERGTHTFVEVGPSATLGALGRRCLGDGHTWLASMRPQDTDDATLQRALTQVYRAGVSVAWDAVHEGTTARRVDLPTYAFERRKYWLPAGLRRKGADGAASRHPLLGTEITTPDEAAAGERRFGATIDAERPSWLADHVVLGQVVFPAAGYVELLLAVQDELYGETGRPLRDIRIHEPLILHRDRVTRVECRVRSTADGGADVEIVSLAADTSEHTHRHVSARIGSAVDVPPEVESVRADLTGAATATGDAPRDVEELYADFADLGLGYGPEFRRITALARHGDVAVADLRGGGSGGEHLPPQVLDGVIQSVAGVLGDGETYLPVGFDTFLLLKKPRGATLRSLLRITGPGADPHELTADMLLTEGDRPVFAVRGLVFRKVAGAAGEGRRRLFHEVRWLKRSLVRGGDGERSVLLVGGSTDGADDVRCAADATAAAEILAGWRPTDVAWLWRSTPGPVDADVLRAECERNYTGLLALLKVLEAGQFGRDQRLWLVTAGAQQETPADAALAAATLWGFGHSLWSENPAYRVTMVDLPGDGDLAPLLGEIQAAEAEEFQVAYRGGNRHVRRIVPVPVTNDDDASIALTVETYGDFAGVRPAPVHVAEPTGDEVRVRVEAAGLNFKDVLNALGLLKQYAEESGLPYHELPLGFEAAGTVVAAGPTADFAPGDDVVVSHLGCMRTFVTVPSAMVVRKPSTVGFAEAAALPTAFVTAYYALHTLAGIKAGDRVLIHAGAGGVGQAAIQLAKLAGAEVIATASPGKQHVLRAQGITRVHNSRTLDFADALGGGVDIVLNSLNKEFIPAGLGVLAPGGRFVELGKIGTWSPEQVRAARPDVSYHRFDLSEFPTAQLQRINHDILATVMGLLEQGAIAPIPVTEYSLEEIEEAFGRLSRGANVGKLVLRMRPRPAVGTTAPAPLDPDGTYLITGGLGALGRVTAKALVDAGARHLALVSRRQVPADALASLRGILGDADVRVHTGDVAVAADVRRIVAEIGAGAHPLTGVVHAAGVLADTPVATLTWPRIDTVFGAKVYGTWLLHEATRDCPTLRFFVGYSSVSAALGPMAQANYAAGNAFVDALMGLRAARHLPGLSIGWGPWAEVGMAAGLTGQQIKAMEAQGVRLLTPRSGARALRALVDRPFAHVLVGEFDWERYAAGRPAPNALYRTVARSGGTATAGVDLDALRQLPAADRRAAISEVIRARIARLLQMDGVDDVAPDAKLMELGLDSLVAVELKNGLEAAFSVFLPTSIVFDYPTVNALAELIDSHVSPVVPAVEEAPVVDVQELSDEDAERELAALRGLGR